MPILEALSFLRALQSTGNDGRPLLWLTDCEPVRRAFLRGYSPSSKLNAIIQAITAFGRDITACWIPTSLNPTDVFSRRHDFVPPMTPLAVLLPDAMLWNHLVHPSYTGAAQQF